MPTPLLDRLDDLPRRLRLLGDELADGLAGLAWRGRSRERFGHRLDRELDDLADLASLLGRAIDALVDHDRGGRV